MSSDSFSPIITVTNTEFYKLIVQGRDGIYIDCQGGWYEISCPSCTRLFQNNENKDTFRCPFCDFEDYLFDWRPDNIKKDGPTLRPIGWKSADILEN